MQKHDFPRKDPEEDSRSGFWSWPVISGKDTRSHRYRAQGMQ